MLPKRKMLWNLPPILSLTLLGAICAVCTGAIAHYTGRRFWPSFLGGFFFGPLAVVFALIFFVPKRWRNIRW